MIPVNQREPAIEEALISHLHTMYAPDDATLLQGHVARFFESVGCKVQWEYPVHDRGDGRPGRIDLLITGAGVRIAMELDRRLPKSKSIFKLKQIPNARRVIVLRGIQRGTVCPEGIDDLICVRVYRL